MLIETNVLGNVIDANEVQLTNNVDGKLVINPLSGNTKEVSDKQFSKQLDPMLETVIGNVNVVNPHALKEALLNVVNPVENVIVFNAVHNKNAFSPNVVIELGNVILFKLVQL